MSGPILLISMQDIHAAVAAEVQGMGGGQVPEGLLDAINALTTALENFDSGGIPSNLVESLATITTRLNAIGAGIVRVITPEVEAGEITLIRGDDYLFAVGRQLTFASDHWPDLTSATIRLSAASTATGDRIIDGNAGQVIKPTTTSTGPASIAFELSSVLTGTLPAGRRSMRFDVQATLAGGARCTLIRSFVSVVADITDHTGE